MRGSRRSSTRRLPSAKPRLPKHESPVPTGDRHGALFVSLSIAASGWPLTKAIRMLPVQPHAGNSLSAPPLEEYACVLAARSRGSAHGDLESLETLRAAGLEPVAIEPSRWLRLVVDDAHRHGARYPISISRVNRPFIINRRCRSAAAIRRAVRTVRELLAARDAEHDARRRGAWRGHQ